MDAQSAACNTYLGLSGMNQMKVNCNREGRIWSSEGIRQAQLFGIAYVPSVTLAAMMAPTYQLSLNRPLSTLECLGKVNSAISCEAPEIQNGMPMPSKIRDTRNMAMLIEPVCKATPTVMIADPIVMLCLRPNRSFTHGTTGKITTAPIEKAAVISPRIAPVGSLKSVRCQL